MEGWMDKDYNACGILHLCINNQWSLFTIMLSKSQCLYFLNACMNFYLGLTYVYCILRRVLHCSLIRNMSSLIKAHAAALFIKCLCS